MLSDDGHQVGEIDRRIKVEGRIHELSTKLVRELSVAVVFRCLFLDRAHDHGEELTPRECAMYLAGLIAQRDLPLKDLLDRYELYSYKQWLRVYMRSKMIKHNKDLFESLDDSLALLEKLHIY